MKAKITKIILVLVLITGCTAEFPGRAYDKEKLLEGVLIDEKSRKPISNIRVKLFREKKPLLSMRNWEEIDQTKTNDNGAFFFLIKLKGDYKLEWNIDGNETSEKAYIKDFTGKEYIEVTHENKYGKKPIWDR